MLPFVIALVSTATSAGLPRNYSGIFIGMSKAEVTAIRRLKASARVKLPRRPEPPPLSDDERKALETLQKLFKEQPPCRLEGPAVERCQLETMDKERALQADFLDGTLYRIVVELALPFDVHAELAEHLARKWGPISRRPDERSVARRLAHYSFSSGKLEVALFCIRDGHTLNVSDSERVARAKFLIQEHTAEVRRRTVEAIDPD